MSKDKRSFFERLTGAVRMESDEEEVQPKITKKSGKRATEDDSSWIEKETEIDGELTVDVYHTPDTIVIKSMIAGVRPEDLDVTITRDMVTVRGKREEERISAEDDFLVQELYWGTFSRTIQLPEEINVDESEAIEKHGLLIIKLLKLDKKRQSKLKVRTA